MMALNCCHHLQISVRWLGRANGTEMVTLEEKCTCTVYMNKTADKMILEKFTTKLKQNKGLFSSFICTK